jgi:pilus assembly protein CpaE
VVVLSPVVKDADAFGLADFVSKATPTTAVVIVKERGLNGLVPAAMRAGVRDVVDLSQGTHELRDALSRALAWSSNLRSARGGDGAAQPGPRGSVIAVFSSKGGTGKTFLACNLAVALAARSGLDTALVDFDLEMGDVLSYFGKDTKRAVDDLIAIGRLSDPQAILEAGASMGNHLWVYASQAVPGTPSVAGEAGGKVLTALRNVFAFTVVDAAATYGDHILATFDLSDMICLISGLDVVGLRHLANAVQNLLSVGVPRDRLRVVLNRADSKVGLDVEEIERVTKLKVDARIPSSRLVPTSLNWGRPVYVESPKSDVAVSVGSLADKVIAEMQVGVRAGSSADGDRGRRRRLRRR